MRFFSSVKTFSGLLNNLGVAASMATAKLWPLASTISTGISVLGNTLDFATRDLEILESDILSGTEQLNILLEEQLEIGKITIADYHGEFPWITHLKRADILLRKRLPIFYATIDGALGCIGDALYLAANTHEDSSSSKNQDFSYSVWAGALIGLQYFVHLLITRHLTSIHQEITVLRHELDLLKDNQDFLAWKVEILEGKKQEIHAKLAGLIQEEQRLTFVWSDHQTESKQKEEEFSSLIRDQEEMANNLDAIKTALQSKTQQLRGSLATEEQARLRTEIKSLQKKYESYKSTFAILKSKEKSASKELEQLQKTLQTETIVLKNKRIEITKIQTLYEKLAHRITELRNHLEQTTQSTATPASLGRDY